MNPFKTTHIHFTNASLKPSRILSLCPTERAVQGKEESVIKGQHYKTQKIHREHKFV